MRFRSGFLAGLLNLIPVLGFWTVVVLCVASAILSAEPGILLLRLAIVFAVEQVIEGQVLTPRIVGRAVGLNPALTLISVLVFGAILGPIGVIIAVPAAAMIRGFVQLHARSDPAERNRESKSRPRPPRPAGRWGGLEARPATIHTRAHRSGASPATTRPAGARSGRARLPG